MDERERAEYFAFLDKRIPQLQNHGKPMPGPAPANTPLGERLKRVVPNLQGSAVPGRLARERADREWSEGARLTEDDDG